MKRILSAALLVLMAVGLSWAGGQREPPKEVTLELWNLWPDATSEPSYTDFNAALKEWEAQNPNIKIKVDSVTNDLYKPKIQTALAADQAPDIFAIFGAAFSEPFVKAGKLLALDPYLDADYKAKILPGQLVFFTYGGKVYGLPTGSSAAWIYANRDLFQKYGIAYPKDFNELLDVVKKFKAQGLVPFAMGNKERWPIILFYEALAVRHGGQKAILDGLSSRKMTDPAFLEAAIDIENLANAGAFRPDVLGISMFAEPVTEFKMGKNPMMYHGSWLASGMETDDSAIKGKVDVLRLPGVSGGKGSELDTWGGAFGMFSVNAKSKFIKEAVEATKFITLNQNKWGYINGTGLPSFKVPVEPSQIKSDINKQIVKLMENTTSLTIGWDLLMDQTDAQNYLDNISSLLGGKITAQQFVKTLPGN